jgi:hypothetical protein
MNSPVRRTPASGPAPRRAAGCRCASPRRRRPAPRRRRPARRPTSAPAATSCSSTPDASDARPGLQAVQRTGQRLPDHGGALLLVGASACSQSRSGAIWSSGRKPSTSGRSSTTNSRALSSPARLSIPRGRRGPRPRPPAGPGRGPPRARCPRSCAVCRRSHGTASA